MTALGRYKCELKLQGTLLMQVVTAGDEEFNVSKLKMKETFVSLGD